MASLYRWWKGSWDPCNCGIGPILKEASMIGGKPLPLHGDPKPNLPTHFRDSFKSWLESNFRHLFLKNNPYQASRGWYTETEHQLAHPLWWISPIGARAELAGRAKAKRSIFRVFHRKLSSEEWLSLSRGMPWKWFQVMSLLIGHGISPPMCGTGDCRDDEKLLCNTMARRPLCQWSTLFLVYVS